MTATGTLYIVAAPSGAGKTSLVKGLLASLPAVEVSVSHTTRSPRAAERDGVDYYFVSVAEFEALIERRVFLEYARVFDHDQYYGTSRKTVLERLQADIDVILEIDWQGARQVREQMPDAVGIFILPPSLDELARRLRQRGQDSEAVITQRMDTAVKEMSHHDEFDYLIVNDDFEGALKALRSIFVSNRQRHRIQTLRRPGLLQSLLS